MVFIKMHVMRCKLLMISSVIIAIVIIFFPIKFLLYMHEGLQNLFAGYVMAQMLT